MCGGRVANRLLLDTDAYCTPAASLQRSDGKSAFELRKSRVSRNSTLQRESSLHFNRLQV